MVYIKGVSRGRPPFLGRRLLGRHLFILANVGGLGGAAMNMSVRDVALRAGVSVGTVSNVLNRPEKVSPKTLERVKGVIEEIGFVPNDAARQLRTGRSSSVGLIVLDIGNPFFAEVSRGAEERAAKEGLTVLLGNSDQNNTREWMHIEHFDQQRLKGILLSPVSDESMVLVERIRGRTPVVVVDREPVGGSISSVSVDDHAGGELAARHLLESGRKRISFVGGSPRLAQVHDRLRGVKDVMVHFPDAHLSVHHTDALGIAEGSRVGEVIARFDSADRPDAIIAVNDLIAIGLLQALMAAGVRVPEDLAIVGYDDIEFASAAVVPLSSVRQPAREIGYAAMDLLLDEESQRGAVRKILFQPELIPRGSSAYSQ